MMLKTENGRIYNSANLSGSWSTFFLDMFRKVELATDTHIDSETGCWAATRAYVDGVQVANVADVVRFCDSEQARDLLQEATTLHHGRLVDAQEGQIFEITSDWSWLGEIE